ncbi:class I SAM-dependent methyltransferase [Alkalicoccus chagannorensis]|uniref:class I SAM-dependent methyltransferase n=1 Tax=Alkalicoccus chagannorensis TaxID=427072 RepID=UPI00040BB0D7|nr:class I SAM-dependent methyltransferase [Alkalicoccus chagannorensis]
MSDLDRIRKEEKQYHEFCYDKYDLYEEGSWLKKPAPVIEDHLAFICKREKPQILDLGAGVGRNSIPMAKAAKDAGGRVQAVDFLASAMEKLRGYREDYNVADVLECVESDIADVDMPENGYDLIVAISSIEHVDNLQTFEKILDRMRLGTKPGGRVIIIANSDIEEYDWHTREKREPLLEVHLSTKNLHEQLMKAFDGWNIQREDVKPLSFEVVRDGNPVQLKSRALTLVVEKPEDKESAT